MAARQSAVVPAAGSPNEELAAIKKLLVFALLRSGAKQGQIAAVLGTSQGTVSKMFGRGAFDSREQAE